MVMKNKQLSMKKTTGAKGGTTKMLQRQATGPQKPGMSSQEQPTDKAGGKSSVFAKGGNTKMFGKQTSKALKPK